MTKIKYQDLEFETDSDDLVIAFTDRVGLKGKLRETHTEIPIWSLLIEGLVYIMVGGIYILNIGNQNLVGFILLCIALGIIYTIFVKTKWYIAVLSALLLLTLTAGVFKKDSWLNVNNEMKAQIETYQ